MARLEGWELVGAEGGKKVLGRQREWLEKRPGGRKVCAEGVRAAQRGWYPEVPGSGA